MKTSLWKMTTIFLAVLCLALFGAALSSAKGPGGGGGKPNPETAGNNLSFPVIWAEGVTKVLPGTPEMTPIMDGEWWYQWGTNGVDPDITPASCPPDPDNELYCDDGSEGSFKLDLIPGLPTADNPQDLAKAYLQKDQNNTWQADSDDWSAAPVDVDWIDWGDNLESVDWYTRSQVRTEVVLFQDLSTPMTEYEMRHTEGWGINEVHGLAATLAEPPEAIEGPGDLATVYSPCARLTIQKLLVLRDHQCLQYLEWVPEEGWTEPASYPEGVVCPDLMINAPIFNMAVHEAADGPGYYNAEINVKGRIIYGYTWNVRRLNDDSGGTAAGDYRITFSFDEVCGGTTALNTFFVDDTEIIVPLEEEIAAAAAAEGDDGESPGGGAVGMLDTGNNLTYMDVRIHERGGGGGGGGSGGGSGGGGGGGNDR